MSTGRLDILEGRADASGRALVDALTRIAFLDDTLRVLEARIADLTPVADKTKFLERRIETLHTGLCEVRGELADIRAAIEALRTRRPA